jgi:hypothetical protein
MSTFENHPTLYSNRLDWACKQHLADDEAQSSAKELIRPAWSPCGHQHAV